MASPRSQQRSMAGSGGAPVLPDGLPDRDVSAASLEDAFVRFVFHCNPAVPRTCDTQVLREAFRSPPRNAGRSFDPAVIYELVRKFYSKEIKTWTELTIALGVAPPDPSKDESSQKLTQYGVRLKKWMNSLHVKSFFEYLMGIQNDYWTNIPNDPDPSSRPVRDGVAVEDDMVLRALLPHMRPKRGRKRPEDSGTPTGTPVSAQRPKLSPSALEYQPQVDPWSSAPRDGSLSAYPETHRPEHLGAAARGATSAVTPTVRHGFWDDTVTGEPQSAVSPSQGKTGRQRRGMKNVSSAWKVGGREGGGKTRGRPPVNRTPLEEPGYGYSSWESHQGTPSSTGTPGNPMQQPPGAVDPVTGQRPARPSISLQVPQREGGSVRLATPPLPPTVTVDDGSGGGAGNQTETERRDGWYRHVDLAKKQYEERNNVLLEGGVEVDDFSEFYFERVEDRTNVEACLGSFMRITQEGEWYDHNGQPAEPASMDEAAAIVNATVQDIYKTATSQQAFLINLGALAGSRTLMRTRPRYYRLPDGEGYHSYKFEWEYRFSHLSGNFTMVQTVPWTMWRRPPPRAERGVSVNDTDGMSALTAEEWRRKYKDLLAVVKQREDELADMRDRVMTSLKEDVPWL